MLGVHHLLDEVRSDLNIQGLFSFTINIALQNEMGQLFGNYIIPHKKFSYKHAHTPNLKKHQSSERHLSWKLHSLLEMISV